MTPEMQRMTFDEVERQWKRGDITDEQFNEYCYEFRNLTFRYSGLGNLRAKWHAEKHGLPIAYSDRKINS